MILLDTLPLSISATGPNSASNLVASSFIIEIRKKCLGGYKMDIAVSPVKGRIEGLRSRRNSLTTYIGFTFYFKSYLNNENDISISDHVNGGWRI